MDTVNEPPSLAGFWAPRYWPIWCLLIYLRISVYLPFRWQIKIGKRFGRVMKRLMRKSSRAALRNLEICFPELTEEERADLLTRHFEALGATIAEMAIGWFAPLDRLRRFVRVEGRENIELAKQRGGGILLYVGHFTCLEIGIAMLEDLFDTGGGMYRPADNPMVDAMVRLGRQRSVQNLIPSDNIRALVRDLRNKAMIVYLPDHAQVESNSELIPFFGEPALTTIATSRLAKMSNATVLAYFFRRLPDDSGYVITLSPPLPDFPSDDPIADTKRMVAQLEDHIRLAPEQYIWTYRRFKGRPPPYPDVYHVD